jgi:hypothetical protein
MTETTIYNWINQEKIDCGEVVAQTTDQALELAAARRRIPRARDRAGGIEEGQRDLPRSGPVPTGPWGATGATQARTTDSGASSLDPTCSLQQFDPELDPEVRRHQSTIGAGRQDGVCVEPGSAGRTIGAAIPRCQRSSRSHGGFLRWSRLAQGLIEVLLATRSS